MSAALLTVPEVCDSIGASEYRVRADVAAGVFPHHRLGRSIRFTDADVVTYLERIAVDRASTHSGQTAASQRSGRSKAAQSRKSA